MISILKKIGWIIIKKYKFLQKPHAFIISTYNLINSNKDSYWISNPRKLNDYFFSISHCEYVLFSSNFSSSKSERLDSINILFKIDHLKEISLMLKRGRPTSNAIRVNLYSLEGVSPFVYQAIAYYPPKLGEFLLSGSILKDGIKTLDGKQLAISTLYNEVYIKGTSNDYEIAQSNDVIDSYKILNLPTNENTLCVRYIDNYLAGLGYRPSLDSLNVFSVKDYSVNSEYLRNAVESEFSKFDSDSNVLTLILRNNEFLETQVEYINKNLPNGYIIYDQGYLNDPVITKLKAAARGGNWYSTSNFNGGEPKYFFTMTNDFSKLDRTQIRSYKRKIREYFYMNMVHTSDTTKEAIYYYSLINEYDWKNLL